MEIAGMMQLLVDITLMRSIGQINIIYLNTNSIF